MTFHGTRLKAQTSDLLNHQTQASFPESGISILWHLTKLHNTIIHAGFWATGGGTHTYTHSSQQLHILGGAYIVICMHMRSYGY
jgi:hypothetical protein